MLPAWWILLSLKKCLWCFSTAVSSTHLDVYKRQDGDWVDYSVGIGFPVLLDAALAKRKDELRDIKIRGSLAMQPIQAVEQDRERKTFTYNSWHCSGYERKLCDEGLCNYIPRCV